MSIIKIDINSPEFIAEMEKTIRFTDKLVPTSSFFVALEDAKLDKNKHIILYCHVGSRSAHVARIMGDMGYTKIGNLTYGIVSYSGEIIR